MAETPDAQPTITPEQDAENWYRRWEIAVDENGKLANSLNAAYRERAALVALLAALYPSHIGPAEDAPGWSIVYVELPTGQASWHIARSDMPLFAHVPTSDPKGNHWDGHTTPEKYQRVRDLVEMLAAAGGEA